jgi:hypothetical protein
VDKNIEERILSELKSINKKLDKIEQRQNYPFQPYTPSTPIQPLNIPPLNCSKCGIRLDQVMGYVCNNHPCPTGLGGVWCSTSELK